MKNRIEKLIDGINMAIGVVARPMVERGRLRAIPFDGSPLPEDADAVVPKEIRSASAFAKALGHRSIGKLSARAVRGTQLVKAMLAVETRATNGRYAHWLLALRNDATRRLHYVEAQPSRTRHETITRSMPRLELTA